jgi:hypothetical protein
MIPVVGGKYKVWTKRLGFGTTKVLLLHGGPAFTNNYLEALESFLPDAGIEMYYYDQLGCGFSDNPDDPSLWTLAGKSRIGDGGPGGQSKPCLHSSPTAQHEGNLAKPLARWKSRPRTTTRARSILSEETASWMRILTYRISVKSAASSAALGRMSVVTVGIRLTPYPRTVPGGFPAPGSCLTHSGLQPRANFRNRVTDRAEPR